VGKAGGAEKRHRDIPGVSVGVVRLGVFRAALGLCANPNLVVLGKLGVVPSPSCLPIALPDVKTPTREA